ncbi:D-lactaldehyde dehydrogenase [Coprinopsis sp. MPI-PUGE-AT-0042]|nr:D-lactaldehyde dehydrogenase [Coprinopsis sp. MPI-PUGE-AT-0042]
MPTVAPGAKVLVTGANGYIAMWTVRKLLEKGYSVRATVRSEKKGAHLVDYFKSYGDKLEIAVVADISKEGAFDEAVKGVDAIEHTASPAHWNAKTPEEIIDPAVNGTLGVLKSAQKYGQTVKRIVVSSSTAAVVQNSDPAGTLFNDKSWNDESVRAVEEKGSQAHGGDIYCASKTLAERAAWKFVEENKSTLSWDLVVLNIPWVFGPPIQEVSTLLELNGSMQVWWNLIIAPLPNSLPAQLFITTNAIWVDVRDIADAHILSLEKEAAGGERILVNAGSFLWHDWTGVVNSLDHSLLPNGKPVPIVPTVDNVLIRRYDATKVDRILGIKWISMKETAKDILEDAARRGW